MTTAGIFQAASGDICDKKKLLRQPVKTDLVGKFREVEALRAQNVYDMVAYNVY